MGRKKDLTVRKGKIWEAAKEKSQMRRKMNITHEVQQRPARWSIGR